MPARSITARTEAPAIIPVPGDAGFSITRADLNLPMTSAEWYSVSC